MRSSRRAVLLYLTACMVLLLLLLLLLPPVSAQAPVPETNRPSSPPPSSAGQSSPRTDNSSSSSGAGAARGTLPVDAAHSSNNVNSKAALDLATVSGCTGSVAGSPFLPPGIDNTCTLRGVLGPGHMEGWTFRLAPATNNTRPYRVMVTLLTIDGHASLSLSLPGVGPVGTHAGTLGAASVFETEVTAEQYITAPWSYIRDSKGPPGFYMITLSGATDRLVYNLKVSTPYVDTRLAEADAFSTKRLMNACCEEDNTSSFCRVVLPTALEPGHSDEDDLCNLPPVMCDAEGRLTQLPLASLGLSCPDGLPANLSGLSALQTLDLAFNNLSSTTDRLAEVLSTLPSLENAFFRYVDIRGNLDCSMLTAARSLKRLSLSGNEGLVGELPGCFFESPSLEELYLSLTNVSGHLPDTVLRNSSLKALFAIRHSDQRNDTRSAGFTGPIPRSLLASKALQYLDLSNHNLSGGLPSLPSNIRLLNMSTNALGGAFAAALPSSLQVLDVSTNMLTGSLPTGLSGLKSLYWLNVSHNMLNGSLPRPLPPHLRVLDVSLNALTGT